MLILFPCSVSEPSGSAALLGGKGLNRLCPGFGGSSLFLTLVLYQSWMEVEILSTDLIDRLNSTEYEELFLKMLEMISDSGC